MRNKLLYILPFIAGLNGISFKVSNLNIRLDQLLAAILCFILVIRIIKGKQKLYLDLPGKFLLGFTFISFFSSYFYSPDKNYSIIQTINVLSAASVYFLIPNLINDKATEKKFMKYYIISGLFMCGLGVAFFILAQIGVTDYGVNLIDDPTLSPYGVFSTMWEPNIYGSYSVIYFIFSLNIILMKDFSSASKKTFLFLLFFSTAGVFLSFTRGVWLASIITIIISIVILRNRFRKKFVFKNFIKYSISISLLLAIFLGYIISGNLLLYKINNFITASSGTGYDRLLNWSVALSDINNHILLGNGTYSFAAIYAGTFYDPLNNPWIGNFLLTVLHDTGIIGTFIFLAFLWTLISRAIKKPADNNNFNVNSFSLGMASIAMLIAFFFTTGFSLCYSWIPLGILSYYNKNTN